MAKLTEMEVKKGDNMKSAEEKAPSWQVKVKDNASFCGIGAGGVQFANGQAVISSERMAGWFMEHDGYEVTMQ